MSYGPSWEGLVRSGTTPNELYFKIHCANHDGFIFRKGQIFKTYVFDENYVLSL